MWLSRFLVRRDSACALPKNPAIQEATGSPNLDAQARGPFSRVVFQGPRLCKGRLEAQLCPLLLMRSVWTERTDCASSRQNPSEADMMLCSCCHRLVPCQQTCSKCQSWLQGLEKRLLPASTGTTGTSQAPLPPYRSENTSLGRVR